MSLFDGLSAGQKKLGIVSAIIVSLSVIFSGITHATGIEIPRFATMNDVEVNTRLIAQNYIDDYDLRIKTLKQDRREVRQYMHTLEIQGQAISPDHQEELDDINEEIEDLRDKKKTYEFQSKG